MVFLLVTLLSPFPIAASEIGTGVDGVVTGGGEAWQHALGVLRVEMQALWSLTWKQYWGRGKREGKYGMRSDKEKVQGALTYTTLLSELAMEEEEEEEEGWDQDWEGEVED
ncbi:hypothetical protein NGA_0380700, partial [Nannochloropsis gaditana CCMP526]|uniref:uncharacterized protein n=1 Tax=Nannochloropsis gaditana (strain CCMP526) TaxID=1093141 RepID=UPI00029F5DF6